MKELDLMTTGDTAALIATIAHDTLKNVAASAGVGTTALMRWIDADAERTAAYIRARATKASMLADETIEIADNGANASAPDPARDKLRIQARQWLAARWDRQQYGDRQDNGVVINVQSLHLDALRRRPAGAAPIIIEALAPPAGGSPLYIDIEATAVKPITIEAIAAPVSD